MTTPTIDADPSSAPCPPGTDRYRWAENKYQQIQAILRNYQAQRRVWISWTGVVVALLFVGAFQVSESMPALAGDAFAIPLLVLIYSTGISIHNHSRAAVVELHVIKQHLVAQTELQQRQAAALEALMTKVKPAKPG